MGARFKLRGICIDRSWLANTLVICHHRFCWFGPFFHLRQKNSIAPRPVLSQLCVFREIALDFTRKSCFKRRQPCLRFTQIKLRGVQAGWEVFIANDDWLILWFNHVFFSPCDSPSTSKLSFSAMHFIRLAILALRIRIAIMVSSTAFDIDFYVFTLIGNTWSLIGRAQLPATVVGAVLQVCLGSRAAVQDRLGSWSRTWVSLHLPPTSTVFSQVMLRIDIIRNVFHAILKCCYSHVAIKCPWKSWIELRW